MTEQFTPPPAPSWDELCNKNFRLEARVAELEAKISDMATLETQRAADMGTRVAELEEALDNSQSLLVAMLLERRPEAEIEAQIVENRAVLAKGREG